MPPRRYPFDAAATGRVRRLSRRGGRPADRQRRSGLGPVTRLGLSVSRRYSRACPSDGPRGGEVGSARREEDVPRRPAHRGYSPLDLGGDIRAAAERVRARMARTDEARAADAATRGGSLGGAPQRFTLTDDDPIF